MTQFISEDDMNNTVSVIVQSLPDGMDGFRQAFQLYESEFFTDEDPVFVRKLASALKTKFAPNQNALWNKLAGE